jgi:hypothetical protein
VLIVTGVAVLLALCNLAYAFATVWREDRRLAAGGILAGVVIVGAIACGFWYGSGAYKD